MVCGHCYTFKHSTCRPKTDLNRGDPSLSTGTASLLRQLTPTSIIQHQYQSLNHQHQQHNCKTWRLLPCIQTTHLQHLRLLHTNNMVFFFKSDYWKKYKVKESVHEWIPILPTLSSPLFPTDPYIAEVECSLTLLKSLLCVIHRYWRHIITGKCYPAQDRKTNNMVCKE